MAQRRSIRPWGLMLLMGVACACSRAPNNGSAQVERPLPLNHARPAPSAGDAAGSVLAISSSRSVPLQWPDMIRNGQLREALTELERLPDSERNLPEARLAMGLLAVQLRDFALAERALQGLSRELPLHADRIERAHAEAALEAGPFPVAAQYLSQDKSLLSQSRAALAWLRAGNPGRANVTINSALSRKSKNKPKQSEAHARYVRAQIALAQGKLTAAREDLVWVLVSVPSDPLAVQAEATLALHKLPPLHKAQRLERAQHFAEVGSLVAAEHELEQLPSAPGPEPLALHVTRVRALAHYNARIDSGKAAELFERVAQQDIEQRPKHLLYQARALSRAGRDREALERYAEVTRQFPSLPQGEEARYLMARLHFTLAEWQQADQCYGSCLQSNSKGGKRWFKSSALYERAVTRLAMGQHALAAADFGGMAKAEADPKERAQLLQLQGASLSAIDQKKAIVVLHEAARLWPLSLPAELARVRLRALGAEVQPWPKPPAAVPSEPVTLGPKSDLLRRIGFDRDAALVIADHERTLVKQHAPRGVETVCNLHAALDDAHQRYRWGRAQIKASALLGIPTADTLWAWHCLYPRPHQKLTASVAARLGLDPDLLYAVMRRESAFKVDAISPAGARGLLQLMPRTAELVAQDSELLHDPSQLFAPAHNVELGARYLKLLSGVFGGQTALIAAAYNAGPQAVSQWLVHGENLPLDVWLARIPYAETRKYVVQVMSNLIRYAWLRGANLPTIALEMPKGLRAPAEAY